MKKLALAALAAVIAAALAATAFASNVNTITFTTSPTKSGTKKKPVPISGKFGFKVTDTEGKRPAALDKLTVFYTGMRINTSRFPGCSAAKIEQAQSDAKCSSKALMATGYARNIAGNQADRNDKSLNCYLTVKLYNSGAGKAALFVKGSPDEADPDKRCVIQVATAIPVSVVRKATGDQLSFAIPANLKNPVGTIRNALVETQLTLAKKTVKKKGKRYGYFETVGGCRKGRRTVTVRFDNEGTDQDTTQSGFARCKK